MGINNKELNKKLMEVIESNQPENEKKILVEELIKKGANISWEDEYYITPLMKSIELGLDKITNWLIDNGAQVNTHNRAIFVKGLLTPLQLAVRSGKIAIVKKLLCKGAKVNANGGSLYDAIQKNNKIAELLINNGADYNSILNKVLESGNEYIYNLIKQKEQEKEEKRLRERNEYIKEIEQKTTYPSSAIGAYVDLKMGTMVNIENLNYGEVKGLLQLFSKNKNEEFTPSQQQEITEKELKNELAKDTKVYIRGLANITGLEDRNQVRKHNEEGEKTEIRKLKRKAGQTTLTKIRGAKTGNYNRCVTMLSSSKIMPFLPVGYGIIKKNAEGIHMAGKYDMFSIVDKQEDIITRCDYEGQYGEDYALERRRNLPIKEELDNISNYWKNIDIKKISELSVMQYNEVIMDILDSEVKFIYWTKDAQYKENLTYDKLQAIYFQKGYYEKTGRTLPIYEYKRFETNYLVETKFNNKEIIDMLKEEILDKDRESLKPRYNTGSALNFLMKFNSEISRDEVLKKVVKQFVQDRLNEYSDKDNINNIWDAVNTIKYAGIIMSLEEEQALKNKVNNVFDNILEARTIMKFLEGKNKGTRTTIGNNKSYSKDILAVVEVLSEIIELAQDKNMEFLKPELEQILEDKIQGITRGINKTILEPLKLKRALDKGNINLAQRVIGQGIDINSECIEGKTPLAYAIQKGNLDATSMLLKKGAYLDVKDRDSYKLFMDAVRNFRTLATISKEIIKILLDEGININKKNKDGYTPLTFAINEGNLELVDVLIKAGADVDIQDGRWKSPIEVAIENKDTKLVKLLIERGASVNRVNVNNKTPLEIAKKMKQKEMVKVLKIAEKEQKKKLPKLKKISRKKIEELKEDKNKIQVKTQNLDEVRDNAKKLENIYQNNLENKSKLKKLSQAQIDDLRKHKEKIQVKKEIAKELTKEQKREITMKGRMQ